MRLLPLTSSSLAHKMVFFLLTFAFCSTFGTCPTMAAFMDVPEDDPGPGRRAATKWAGWAGGPDGQRRWGGGDDDFPHRNSLLGGTTRTRIASEKWQYLSCPWTEFAKLDGVRTARHWASSPCMVTQTFISDQAQAKEFSLEC